MLGVAACWTFGAVGCAPATPVPTVGAQRGSLVQLDVAYTRELAAASTPNVDARLEAEAHFIRYRAADPQIDRGVVASLLGLGDDASIPLDTCRRDQEAREPGWAQRRRDHAQGGAVAVEGRVATRRGANPAPASIRDGSQATVIAQLEPQHYPELFPFVTGVVYGQEQSPAPPLPEGAAFEVEADGGEDVGPFLAAGVVPAAFPDLYAWRDLSTGALELRGVGRVKSLAKTIRKSTVTPSMCVGLGWTGVRGCVGATRARDDGSFSIDPSPGARA